jgi:hypothetical protein
VRSVSSNTQYAVNGQWSISYSLNGFLESENDAALGKRVIWRGLLYS